MAITIRIPTPLRKYTDGKEKVQVVGSSVRAAIAGLEEQHPGIRERLCDEAGGLRRFVNVYYKEEDIRFLKNLDTELEDGGELSIVPAIAGGV